MLITGWSALRHFFLFRRREAEKLIDKGKFVGVWSIEKFESDEALARKAPYEVAKFHNIFVTTGLQELWKLVTAQGGTSFSAANAFIGIGDSNTAAAIGQADLQAVSNKLRVAMDASFPNTPVGGLEQWKSTFSGVQANYAWNEFGVFNAGAAGTMLNRAVSVQGTKTAGQPWTVTAAITIT